MDSRVSPTSGYSIRVVSRITGLSADTLRMWERRYGFPKPERTSTGIRVYSQADVDRLTLVASALGAGFRAGEVIARDPAELRDLLASSLSPRVDAGDATPSVRSLLESLEKDDVEGLRAGLQQAVATLGPIGFLSQVAGPLTEQVGDAWAEKRIGVRHEHLFSAALSTQLRLLGVAWEMKKTGPVVLLTTLPGEHHGLGIEMAAVYLSIQGAVPRLLGVDTPVDEIVEAARELGARIVGLSVSAASERRTIPLQVRAMLVGLPSHVAIWLGGKAAREIAIDDPRVAIVETWSDVDRELARLGWRR